MDQPRPATLITRGRCRRQFYLAWQPTELGSRIEWDTKNLVATNAPEASQFISKQYRAGWGIEE